MIFGIDHFAQGKITVDGTPLVDPTPAKSMEAGLAFLTEDRRGEGLVMDFSIAENTILASLQRFAKSFGMIDQKSAFAGAQAIASRVHLSTDRIVTTRAKHLSGGNQQKVVIGKWLLREPRVFILDEPTRGIDVGAKQEVYRIINALVEAGSAVLLISSEIEELMGLSDRILTINRGEITASFERAAFEREEIMAAATRTQTGKAA
jgi:ABC-type sugar transport system ATPase subunit